MLLAAEKENAKKLEAHLFARDECVEQADAQIPAGGAVRLYAVGSSATIWMTWIDQLHLHLKRLGYQVPVVNATLKPRFHPTAVPMCDDSEYFESLPTARFGRIGWSSWDFSYEGWDGCDANGYRKMDGPSNISVKCQHGPGCHYSKNPFLLSELAKDAAKSDVTLVSTWFNDDQQGWSKFKCFGRKKLAQRLTASISIGNLLRMTRAIHAVNPDTWVLIVGKYPQSYLHITAPWFRDLQAEVKQALEKEPRTLFIDYTMPPDYVAHMYQQAHPGHPNCRGSRIMVNAILERLYEQKILARSLRLLGSEVLNSNCSRLDRAACHSSVLCWADVAGGECKPYGPGTKNWHVVRQSTI